MNLERPSLTLRVSEEGDMSIWQEFPNFFDFSSLDFLGHWPQHPIRASILHFGSGFAWGEQEPVFLSLW